MKLPDAALIENLREVAWLKDGNARFVAVNRAFTAEFHVAQRDVIGKTDYYVFPVQLARRLLDNDLEVMRAGLPLRVEDCISRDDTRKWVEALKSPVFDATGKILGTLTVLRKVAGSEDRSRAMPRDE